MPQLAQRASDASSVSSVLLIAMIFIYYYYYSSAFLRMIVTVIALDDNATKQRNEASFSRVHIQASGE
jgi:uncharacterized protein YybS (DUF2232 family)